jgi:hypothetical protein
MTRFLRAILASALTTPTLLALPACGSDVGAGGSGGSGAGGAGGGPAECPPTAPTVGAPCALPADESCTYDTCCAPLYQCQEGAWQVILPPCVPPEQCPLTPPATGDACDFCFQDSPCTYDLCGTGEGVITAACTETGSWFAESSACLPPPDCGGVTCAPGEVCVETAGGPGISHACAPNPCAPAPLTCDCAAELCGGEPFECTGVDGLTVSCVCPLCP